MKNVIFVTLIIVLILIIFGVIDQYNLIDIKWSKLAAIGAGIAGPFSFFQNKLSEKKENKEQFDREIQFRTIDYKQIQARQKSNRVSNLGDQPTLKSGTESDDFNITEPTYG